MAYHCVECGFTTARWMGFCPQCRRGRLQETSAGAARASEVVSIAQVSGAAAAPRLATGSPEVDRVVGGGLVPGSTVLVGGEPGVGKSTLLLQVASRVAERAPALLVSAEESVDQVAGRAARLGVIRDDLLLCSDREVDAIVATMERVAPALTVVDSVQTVAVPEVGGPVGGVSQVREVGARLVAAARRLRCPVMLIGHVTKDGAVAGPKVLEHVVDAVLVLEGDHDAGVRLLRVAKNRYGSADRVGVFEMTSQGLVDVTDPSELMVGGWAGTVAGSVLFPTVHGRRAVLVEVQALTVPTTAPQPRRSVKGVDPARVHQLLAVLERHAGISLRDHEVYVSVVGGFRVREPAADLPIALALASSRLDRTLGRIAAFGEVGLAGELRPVGRRGVRAEEADRLGIDEVAAPSGGDRLVDVLARWALVGPGRSMAA